MYKPVRPSSLQSKGVVGISRHLTVCKCFSSRDAPNLTVIYKVGTDLASIAWLFHANEKVQSLEALYSRESPNFIGMRSMYCFTADSKRKKG